MENQPEPYPGFSEEAANRGAKIESLDRAHTAILPGPLREAFAGEPNMVEGFTLLPITLGLSAALERVNSPLLAVARIHREIFKKSAANGSDADKMKEELTQRAQALESQFEPEQAAETIFIFVTPPKQLRRLLDQGRHVFRESAMDAIGDKLHPSKIAILQQACARHYIRSFLTTIGYGVPPPDGEVVFPPPSASAATDSAGG